MSQSQKRKAPQREYVREERRYRAALAASRYFNPFSDMGVDLDVATDVGLLTEDEYDQRVDVLDDRRARCSERRRQAEAEFESRTAHLYCLSCGDYVYAKGRCRSCYVFRRKHRRDRTEDEMIANHNRQAKLEEIADERRRARRVLLERDH